MTYWLVANPEAGDGQRGREFWLEQLKNAGITAPECCDFREQGWQAQVKLDDIVMVAGGDGSVNTGASLCLERNATLAVLPSGTANDFARNLALPDEPAAVCELVQQGVTQLVDVAEFGGGIFLNVAHVGLGTLPARESKGSAKKLLGRFSYGVELLRKVNAKRGFHAEIQCDQAFVRGHWLSIAVSSGAFFGGGNEIPQATADDGLLDVIAVKPRPLLQLLLTFFLVQFSGKSPKRTSTVVHLKGKRCDILTSREKTVTVDGDEAGKTPLHVVCRKHCLRVIGSTVVSTGEAEKSRPGLK
ncbi:lipid kinase, YegS/Rv2252/BmrU family [Marinobacter sp. LV10R510-11A]|uniref:diacylglycerol/lipid kinase family protein n=1 Tax=Marinobacter sp. LV10R510-11A TaxID=1415568 RepID=UPI000BB99AB7|nr:YegS/Rv2252/BmrU family lipid kinase [Marinobacter sp. LV10R510-11A]SOB78258.1 lipid kinase, YegS/Rv2252/BmrU family [Marinobacter sp. LV10R510-11A]